ncbi:SET domain-containing protein [Hypoxylon cercidicola]|nr:SET domain-containing protein [Hypoxylon cercidicola]
MNPPKSQGMVEIRWLDSIQSEAVFARRAIRRGTRIAAETPLVVVPPVPKEKELSTFCDEIYQAPDSTAKIAELPIRPLVKERIKKDHYMNQQVWEFYKAKRWIDSKGTLLKGKKLHKTIMKTMDLCTIFRTNSVHLGPEGRYGSGLFSLYGRINHSCVPNTHNSYNPTLKRLTIHAIHDIKAGDQICVDYIGDVCRTRQQRAFSLYNTWGITCNCVACTDPQINRLRCRMLLLDQAMKQALAAYECGASTQPNFAAIHGVPRVTTAAKALRTTKELVHILKAQGLHGTELCRTLRECSKYALDSGSPDAALQYAREELQLEISLIGKETSHLEADFQGAKYWVKHIRALITS